MIASLTGTVEYFTENGVVLDVGGIGFDVQTSAETMQILGAKGAGETVHLHICLNTGREGETTLYGFLSREELRLFRQLITVSGIGPKGALSLLSAMSADDLIFAILSGDAKTISRAPGIGKKTAERLVLDLRDKLAARSTVEEYGFAGPGSGTGKGAGKDVVSAAGGTEGTFTGGGAADTAAADAAEALTALGYARLDAVKAVKQARNELETQGDDAGDTEALLRCALRYIG